MKRTKFLTRCDRSPAEWDDGNRIETMVESTKRLIKTLKADTSEPKIVVFASSSDRLRPSTREYEEDGDGAVIYLLTTDDAEASAEIVEAFEEFT